MAPGAAITPGSASSRVARHVRSGPSSTLLAARAAAPVAELDGDPPTAEDHLAALATVADRGRSGSCFPRGRTTPSPSSAISSCSTPSPTPTERPSGPPSRRRPAHPAPPTPFGAAPPPPCQLARRRPHQPVPSPRRFLLSRMDFKRPARSQSERTGREDRRLKFYGLRDNPVRRASCPLRCASACLLAASARSSRVRSGASASRSRWSRGD